MIDRVSARVLLLALAISVFCVLQGHKLLTLGTNADGAEYGAIGRNLGEGYGTPFAPWLSETVLPVHYEQPPLLYWIQAPLFNVFGDGPHFEAFYGFVVGLLILALTAVFWRRFTRESEPGAPGAWWPVLLLLSLPGFEAICQSNRLVFTLVVFALLSAWFSYRSLTASRWRPAFAAAAGVMLYCGFHLKGPAALFVLALPAAAALTLGVRWRTAAWSTLVSAASFGALLGATLLFLPESRALWRSILEDQVLASVAGARESRGTYLYLPVRLAAQLVVPVGIAAALCLVMRVSLRRLRVSRPAAFLLLVALAGSLPFFFIPRQKVRYLLPVYPFLTMALALIAGGAALRIQAALRERPRLRTASAILLVVLLLASVATAFARRGEVIRAHSFHQDIYLQDLPIPPRSRVGIYPQRIGWEDHLLQHIQRYMKLSVTLSPAEDYLIIDRSSGFEVPPGYERLNRDPVLQYEVYRKVRPQ